MLYCGSYSYLKEKLKEHLEKIEKGKKLSFIVHTNQMKTYLKEYLVKELGIVVNAEFFTLIDISKRLTKIEPLQDFDKELILKKFLYEKGLQLDGLPEEFNLLLQQIKEYEIPVNNLKSDFVKDIINLYEDFKKELYYDREDVHRLATEKETDFSTDYIFIFGIKSVPSLHQKLFKRLKNLSKEIYVFLPVRKETGYYQNYPHFKEVIDFFEGLTGKSTEEQTSDGNVQTADYIYRFEYNIPVIKNHKIKLIKASTEYEELEYVSQKILNLVKEKSEFFHIGVVVPQINRYLPFIKEIFQKYKIPYYVVEENRYIDEPVFRKLFGIFEIKEKNFTKEAILNILSDELFSFPDIQKIEEEILYSPFLEGFEDWEKYFFKENSFKEFKEFLSILNSVPDKSSLDEFISYFEYINNTFIKNEKAKNFLSNLFDTLKDTTLYKRLFEKIEYTEFASIIKTFFLQENKENKIKANTVSVLTPISAEGNNFKYLFFLNLNSGDFPSTIKDEILATSLELNNVNYPYHLLLQQILNFCNLLDKNKEIHLSYITRSITSGQKAPSFLIEEIKRVLPIEEEIFKVEKQLTLKDFYVENAHLLKDFDANLKDKYEKFKKVENPHLEDFIFNIGGIFPVSPTDFSIYAQCPYRFFLEKIIGIQELEEPDRTAISPLEKGILLHRLLEDFYKNDCENLEERIEKLKKQYTEEIERLLEFVLPSYRPFELQKSRTLLERVEEFIRMDAERLSKKQLKVAKDLLEKEFKDEHFIGRIDRVDVDTSDNHYVYDYKTGEKTVDNIEEEVKSRYIQLLIYKRFLEKENRKVKEIGIFAVNDKNRKFIYTIDNNQKLKLLETHIESLLKKLKNGFFYPEKSDLCDFCQFNDFCVKDSLETEEV